MIFIMVLLDIIVNNYTSYTSYFFLISLYNKPFKYYLAIGLLFDLIIFTKFFSNTIILIIMYLLNKLLKDLNKSNIYNYIFILLFNYILFIMLSNLFNLNIYKIFLSIGMNLFINLSFYLLSFRLQK